MVWRVEERGKRVEIEGRGRIYSENVDGELCLSRQPPNPSQPVTTQGGGRVATNSHLQTPHIPGLIAYHSLTHLDATSLTLVKKVFPFAAHVTPSYYFESYSPSPDLFLQLHPSTHTSHLTQQWENHQRPPSLPLRQLSLPRPTPMLKLLPSPRKRARRSLLPL